MDAVHKGPDIDTDMSAAGTGFDALPRATYRHGDLHRALLEAGVELARAGGPDAVVLREATRRAGVVPNAAYRHFASRDDLLRAVRVAALAALAQAIEGGLAGTRKRRDPLAMARARLRALGSAYVHYAEAEPGLFRTAFSDLHRGPTPAEPAMAGASGLNPFQLLGAVLDEMATAGALPPSRRPGAEYVAWSTVHGLALLLIDGPLRVMPAADRERVIDALLDMLERGLA